MSPDKSQAFRPSLEASETSPQETLDCFLDNCQSSADFLEGVLEAEQTDPRQPLSDLLVLTFAVSSRSVRNNLVLSKPLEESLVVIDGIENVTAPPQQVYLGLANQMVSGHHAIPNRQNAINTMAIHFRRKRGFADPNEFLDKTVLTPLTEHYCFGDCVEIGASILPKIMAIDELAVKYSQELYNEKLERYHPNGPATAQILDHFQRLILEDSIH